jgi:predicted transposase YdaD
VHESSTYQAILEEGRAKGYILGQMLALQGILLRLGRKRFGRLSPRVKKTILAITHVPRLKRLTDRILTATSWQDLLDTP